ncbi:P-loop containing nucleoside triphosphate hydrolase protein, partial [Linnemannia elongata AG-77]
LMGESGSGKTTLLNLLAGRVDKNQVSISGDILFNGQHPQVFRKRGEIGYLQQEDTLLPSITVRETLDFAAKLRLPASTSKHERQGVVESLMSTLGLKDCAEVRVGDSDANEAGDGGKRGLSGGERRRVSAAIQLLTRPNLLLCDEVTSGLDSFTSFELVKTLDTYAKTFDKTVILSIHQPRSEIYYLLSEIDGRLVLLSRGRVVYSGPLNQVLSWFVSMGVEDCPVDTNPLDYIMDNSALYSQTTLDASRTTPSRPPRINTKSKAINSTKYPESPGSAATLLDTTINRMDSFPNVKLLLWTQVVTLSQRHWINTRRNAVYFWGTMAVYIVFAVMVGVVFWKLDGGIVGIRGRASVIYVIGSFQPYLLSILSVYKGVADMKVYDRERKEQLYSPAAFIISYSLCQIPVNIVAAVAHTIIIYYMAGLRTDGVYWMGWFLVTSILLQCSISAMAMLAIAFERDFDRAALISGAFYLCSALTAGFIIPTNQIPRGVRWIEIVSFHRLAYQTWTSLEFTDRRFACPFRLSPTSITRPGSLDLWDPVLCVPWEGNTILVDILQVKPHDYPDRLIYFALHYFEKKQFLEEESEIRVDIPGHDGPTRASVTIRVVDLSLSLVKRGLFERVGLTRGSDEASRVLLAKIDIVIPPAKLTAILGGSGSGKTTLLNALLNRTQEGIQVSGDIYFNRTKNPSIGQINTVSGYVRQGDGMLLTHLTVRETLDYAAELGVGKTLSAIEKRARVEEVIELMGLQECADVMIGNSEKSGCSGGQRRRVSIGIQLVNEPACLFLDEPTSGLDALTALSVMQTLKRIATSGRTVVCTIHQPRVEIWEELDDVILLVSGGRLAYAGRADQAMDHFERAGHSLPLYTNPPDFMIDTASVNFRSREQEAASRTTINVLATFYKQEQAKKLHKAAESGAAGGIGASDGSSEDTLGTEVPHHAGFIAATRILTQRMFKNAVRQHGAYLNRIMEPFLISVIITLFYWGLEDTPDGLLNRLGLFHQLMGGALSGLIIHLEVFPKESGVALSEMSNGSYSASSFLLAYMLNELPITIVSSSLSALWIMAVTRLRTTVASAAVMVLVNFAYITAGESLGIAYSCYFASSAGLGVALMNSTIVWLSFLAGFLIVKLPPILQVVNYVSVFRYASISLALEEFRGLQVSIPAATSSSARTSTLSQLFFSGDAVLSYLEWENQSLGFNLGMIVVLMVAYRLMAWAVLTTRIRSLLA